MRLSVKKWQIAMDDNDDNELMIILMSKMLVLMVKNVRIKVYNISHQTCVANKSKNKKVVRNKVLLS